ncbi:MAG: ATP-dependent DNA helicase PcrA [Phormidesmis priestleyi Ana]|uniref:ATP-dependent DNA helicase n=1 Tax=Phormidesmis priestleyi Ana TaxID=1666911 RepID=A0A0N8KMP1_9CYAN|nr:MAG: ATP-dependent DNA helicase PcrA [Phormidesmis priestleyi Ana]
MVTTVDFLQQLNPSQRQAVEHFCGPLLVVAGAGSGKTRALTARIANLILNRRVDPGNILAVTFTNKAAREMKERIEKLFAEQEALARHSKPLHMLSEYEQIQLRSYVYKTFLKELWIGTFHSLCSRILRFDIEKYQSPDGQSWTKSFSIFDESDAQSLVKSIVINQMNLDDRKFNPRSVRFAISNAKNQGQTPDEYEEANPTFKGRAIAEVYRYYQRGLSANNALDFDDLIRVPVQLFRQNEQVLDYWHRRFRHILVDEYQDTNRTQYDLIQLLTTNGKGNQSFDDWKNRSVFVVGDADQSIYSFRAADFTILMGFQKEFGDGLADEETETLVKLEENYRSTSNILDVANHLIENNTERIEKILRATRGEGDAIFCHRADNEAMEAEYVVSQIRNLEMKNPELNWKDFAILYRTNVQSRAMEEVLTRFSIPYKVVGGLRFYDRREIKDILAYLRLVVNPADSVSLKRIINTPRRGIGKTTLDNLDKAAAELEVPLWDIMKDETSLKTLAGRASKSAIAFSRMVSSWQERADTVSPTEIVQEVLENTGYLEELKSKGTEEDLNRIENIQELYSAVAQFEEENEDATLNTFLANAALSSDNDKDNDENNQVTLMTLHASKGLEFAVVFLVGLEQGLFPSFRSLEDAAAIEEERRLCYVGITRAQDRLFLSHARERRTYGHMREVSTPSIFLSELPRDYIMTTVPSALPERWATTTREANLKNPQPNLNKPGTHEDDWSVGVPVNHKAFGEGKVTHIFGAGNKICLAIHFPGIGKKIIDPRTTTIERLG